MDAVVSHHLNPFRSGVARFNALLAERLGVPLVGLHDAGAVRAPLLSFKVSELGPADARAVAERLPGWSPDLFLHEWRGTELERALVARAGRVLCGNRAIVAGVAPLHPRVESLWTPGLITEERRIAPAELTVFSFGMAHKIRTDRFRRLRDLLEATGRSYAVRVSTANHETATLADAEAVFAEMHALFDGRAYFLGTLSDLAVVHELERATFFAAFFACGVRANNTTVASAMERGAVVITNLDEASPEGLRHLETVVDLEQATTLPADPLELRRMSVAAMEYARGRGWDRLVDVVRDGSRLA
jgi:hypothetical protein